jgi:hypothetical protein
VTSPPLRPGALQCREGLLVGRPTALYERRETTHISQGAAWVSNIQRRRHRQGAHRDKQGAGGVPSGAMRQHQRGPSASMTREIEEVRGRAVAIGNVLRHEPPASRDDQRHKPALPLYPPAHGPVSMQTRPRPRQNSSRAPGRLPPTACARCSRRCRYSCGVIAAAVACGSCGGARRPINARPGLSGPSAAGLCAIDSQGTEHIRHRIVGCLSPQLLQSRASSQRNKGKEQTIPAYRGYTPAAGVARQ